MPGCGNAGDYTDSQNLFAAAAIYVAGKEIRRSGKFFQLFHGGRIGGRPLRGVERTERQPFERFVLGIAKL